jgi:hypothetical protein
MLYRIQLVMLGIHLWMTQVSRLTPGTQFKTISELTAVLKSNTYICQMMMWKGPLVMHQMLELCQTGIAHTGSGDRVTGKVTVDQ